MELKISEQKEAKEDQSLEGYLKKIHFHVDRMVDSATNEINISACHINIGSATGPWRTDTIPSDVRNGSRYVLARWGHNIHVTTCAIENNKYMWITQPSSVVCSRCDPNAWAEIFSQEVD